MDQITQNVRAMYEQFPYPHGAPMIRAATDVRLLLSYIESYRIGTAPLNVLDAGCGRGVGLIPCAVTQPNVNFLGIDINRVALTEAKQAVQSRGITNLKFAEIDLMTLEGLEVPEGGFDVIYSSGVLHHLSNPQAGLEQLKKVLAPHGVIVIMVYAKHGRAPLYRLRNAAEILLPTSAPLQEKIAPSRSLAKLMCEDTLQSSPWTDTPEVVDVEFVDRVLNVQETSYSIDEMWTMLEQVGMEFIRWIEPSDWKIDELLPQGPLQEHAMQLSPRDQFRFIEAYKWRTSLQLIVSHAGVKPRVALTSETVLQTAYCVSPEVSISTTTRNIFGSQRIEELTFQIRGQDKHKITDSAFTRMLLVLRDQNMPFTGESLASVMLEEGVTEDTTKRLLAEFVQKEILYRPHRSECS